MRLRHTSFWALFLINLYSLCFAGTDAATHMFALRQLCQDPSFDAAVYISQSYLLLFKDPNLWLLKLNSFTVNNVFLLETAFRDCFANNSIPNSHYYVWNRHDEKYQFENEICINRGDDVYHYKIQVLPENNYASEHLKSYQYEELNVTRHSSRLNNRWCQKDVHNNTIQVLAKNDMHVYNQQGPQRVWLRGRHFTALISYTPTTYDPMRIIFQCELVKLSREIDEDEQELFGKDLGGNIRKIDFEKEDHVLNDVKTFAVLPYDEIMVFFADEFCTIKYHKPTCNRKQTANLIGCSMPMNEWNEQQLPVENITQSDDSLLKQTTETFFPTQPISTVAPESPFSLPVQSFNVSSVASASTHTVNASSVSTSVIPTVLTSSTASSSVSFSTEAYNRTYHTSEQTTLSSVFVSSVATSATNDFVDITSTSTQFDIDYLYNKRYMYKKMKKTRTLSSNNQHWSWQFHSYYLHIGIKAYWEIIMRAFIPFFNTLVIIQLLLLFACIPLIYIKPRCFNAELFIFVMYSDFVRNVDSF